MIKAIVFDLDGTLLNTIEDIADCTNDVMKSYGFPISPLENYYYYVGDGIEDMIKSALPEEMRSDKKILHKCVSDFRKQYEKNWHKKTYIYPGISNLLQSLKKRGILLNILSNKPDDFTHLMVSHYFGEETFEEIWGKKDDFPLKPNPLSLNHLIDKLQLKPEEVLFVGDTNVDILTAKNANVFSVGVLWGFRTKEELQNAKADLIIKSPEELLNFIQLEV